MLISKAAKRAGMTLVCLAMVCLYSCQEKSYYDFTPVPKHKEHSHYDTDSSIFVSEDIFIQDKGKRYDSLFNYPAYVKFLKTLLSSDRFLFVPLNELNSTFSVTKTIIALRHDVDYDINSAIRFAKKEHDLGIRSTYFILHTADYYSEMPETGNRYIKKKNDQIFRKSNVLQYLRKIQDQYGHEIGWHNDLLTLLAVYDIDPGSYLKEELEWLKGNNINIYGTASHGSKFCYDYHYLNGYIWSGFPFNSSFYNYDVITLKNDVKQIKKYKFSDFGLSYDANMLKNNAYFADVPMADKKRWHPNMVDWNSFKPGDKVIILFHPSTWDSY